jgi:hypothetical protein
MNGGIQRGLTFFSWGLLAIKNAGDLGEMGRMDIGQHSRVKKRRGRRLLRRG